MASRSRIHSHSTSQGIAAIYDIVWHASTHPAAPLTVQPIYNGSRIIFKKELMPTSSPSIARKAYRAVLRLEGRETVYRCSETLFSNFNIPSAPPSSTVHLTCLSRPVPSSPPSQSLAELQPLAPSSAPNDPSHSINSSTLSLTFTTTPSTDSDGNPFLLFQYRRATEMLDEKGEKLQMCVIGWAKRREYDDEVPTGKDTCLSAEEREMLMMRRGDIDMVLLEKEAAEKEWIERAEAEDEDEMEGLEEGEVRE